MLNQLITDSVINGVITLPSFFICVLTALALGLLTALVFTAYSYHTGSLAISLVSSTVAVFFFRRKDLK